MVPLHPVPPGPAPTRVSGPSGPWTAARDAFRDRGYVLVHAQVEEWRPAAGEARSVRRLLGHEAGRLEAIAAAGVRDRFTVSRLLVKYAAGALLDADPVDLELARHPNGRPYLRGFGRFEITLSHTGRTVAVGLSGLGPIGVDVEQPGRPAYAAGLAENVCTPGERSALDRLPARDRNAALIRLWTLKEAYSKALGLGARLPFRSFGFTAPDGGGVAPRLLRADGRPSDTEGWRFETHALEGGCTLSAAIGPSAFAPTGIRRAADMVDQRLMRAALGGPSRPRADRTETTRRET